MPKPTESYTIGTVSYELTEQGKKELYGPEPRQDRHIRFQVWYPADGNTGGKLTKWPTDRGEFASGIPVLYNLPSFLLDHTALIKSHSYFAVSINHTYGAAVSVFENGEVVYVDQDALPGRSSVDDVDVFSHSLVSTFAHDDRAVLDFLETNTFFAGRIDKEKVGAMGHSTGGGGVVSLAMTDPRIKAVLGLDAWVEPIKGDILKKGLPIPSAFLRSEQWETGPNNEFLKQLFDNSAVRPSIYQVQGGNHQDFSMLYMYLPITRILGETGTLDPLENAEIQQSFVLTFFDQNLKQAPGNLQNWFKSQNAVSEVTKFE